MLNVANPIYDIVFKYLMEDERIARTILSALLKKDVVWVQMKRHEYTNGTRDKISMFRIDFAARIRESDGEEHLVLIELQKTWLETETLRFRQYLGAHYANPENMQTSDNGRISNGIPMVAVYLLGHKVGDIEEPVLYVSHKAYDYDDTEVTKGIPDPFVDSLTHDSIIVQIPRLRGTVHNRLEKVLSVFDQTLKDSKNRQVLCIDETLFDDDKDMQRIVNRLMMAASDAQLRQDMNVEDEYFSAIETRDTEIMQRDERIKELDSQIKDKDSQIENMDSLIKDKDSLIKDKDSLIKDKDSLIKDKDSLIKDKDSLIENMDSQIKDKDSQIEKQQNLLSQQRSQLSMSVNLLYNNGLSISDICRNLNLQEDDVKAMLDK